MKIKIQKVQAFTDHIDAVDPVSILFKIKYGIVWLDYGKLKKAESFRMAVSQEKSCDISAHVQICCIMLM